MLLQRFSSENLQRLFGTPIRKGVLWNYQNVISLQFSCVTLELFSSHTYFLHLSTAIRLNQIIIFFFLLPIANGAERNSHNSFDLHDMRGRKESMRTGPKSGSAETSEVKGKMMDQNRREDDSKKSNQHPRTENKSKNKKRDKPTQESEESARTISSSDRKMKEGAWSLKGICFSSNYSVSDVSEVFTPKFKLFSFILATLSFRTLSHQFIRVRRRRLSRA